MSEDIPQAMSIDELAAAGGVNRRTVRYYIQRGLLAAPFGVGRGKHYGPEHLRRLIEVRTLQENGASLEQIRSHYPTEAFESASTNARALSETRIVPKTPSTPRALVSPTNALTWAHLAIADGVELHVRLDQLSSLDIDEVIASIKAQLITFINTTSTSSNS